jgi:hypothetical protein
MYPRPSGEPCWNIAPGPRRQIRFATESPGLHGEKCLAADTAGLPRPRTHREEEDQIPGYGPRATEPTGNRNGYLDSSAMVAIHLRGPCQTRPCGSAHSARNRYDFLRFGRGRHPAALKPISREHNPPRSPTMGPPAFGRHSARSRISESCMPRKRLFDPLKLTAQLDGTSQVDTVARTVLLKLPAAS